MIAVLRLAGKAGRIAMFGNWLAKGFVAFLLTFAIAGLAYGQTKSADLPVPQRINCAPNQAIPTDRLAEIAEPAAWAPFWKPTANSYGGQFELSQLFTNVYEGDLSSYWPGNVLAELSNLSNAWTEPLAMVWWLSPRQ
jgi:hypothetical protein